jgi:hypothetical protein
MCHVSTPILINTPTKRRTIDWEVEGTVIDSRQRKAILFFFTIYGTMLEPPELPIQNIQGVFSRDESIQA